jgi:crotonobetainyl-CoA:carnitine CoA-transferase CaiB-like acyl-CoA transferase
MARALVQTLGLDITTPSNAWGEPEAAVIATAIAPHTTESLLARLHAAGIWAAACNPNAREDILRSLALQAAGTILSTRHEKYGEILQIGRLFSLSRSPTTPRGQTATLGQHSKEILAELGYTEPEITHLFATATVA